MTVGGGISPASMRWTILSHSSRSSFIDATFEKAEMSSPPEADAPVWHMEQVESKSGLTALSNAAWVGAPAEATACGAAALAGALDLALDPAAWGADFAGGLVVDSAASSRPT